MNSIELENGRKIFESIPKAHQPRWGLNLLLAFDKYLKETPLPVKDLISIANDETRWGEAHAQFQKIRKFLLDNKTYNPENYLLLAEQVAKVTYNASNRPSPFDYDSGWWIAGLAINTANYFNDKGLNETIETLIVLKK